jgi:hypothetical protein
MGNRCSNCDHHHLWECHHISYNDIVKCTKCYHDHHSSDCTALIKKYRTKYRTVSVLENEVVVDSYKEVDKEVPIEEDFKKVTMVKNKVPKTIKTDVVIRTPMRAWKYGRWVQVDDDIRSETVYETVYEEVYCEEIQWEKKVVGYKTVREAVPDKTHIEVKEKKQKEPYNEEYEVKCNCPGNKCGCGRCAPAIFCECTENPDSYLNFSWCFNAVESCWSLCTLQKICCLMILVISCIPLIAVIGFALLYIFGPLVELLLTYISEPKN